MNQVFLVRWLEFFFVMSKGFSIIDEHVLFIAWFLGEWKLHKYAHFRSISYQVNFRDMHPGKSISYEVNLWDMHPGK